MGVILGECQLASVTQTPPNPDLGAYGWFLNGRFTWHLSNPVAYSVPLKAKGFVRLWPWEKPER